jgi:hypothetical protein
MEKIRQLLRLSLVNESGAADIRAMIGERSYPDQLASITKPILPCVNFDITGGPFEQVLEAWRGTVRTWCWSEKNNGAKSDAWKLHDLLVLYWHQNSLDNSILSRYVHLMHIGTPLDIFDDSLRAYAVVSDYQIIGAKT